MLTELILPAIILLFVGLALMKWEKIKTFFIVKQKQIINKRKQKKKIDDEYIKWWMKYGIKHWKPKKFLWAKVIQGAIPLIVGVFILLPMMKTITAQVNATNSSQESITMVTNIMNIMPVLIVVVAIVTVLGTLVKFGGAE
jgi:hypothetical protein